MSAQRRVRSVEASAISVAFGGVDVLHAVDIELRPGKILAITGENGAGKSTLAKVLAGVYRPREGAVKINGEAVRFKHPREALKAGIALIHQEPLGFPELNIAENIFVGHHPGIAGFVDWGKVYQQSAETLGQLGIYLDPHSKVGGLSVAEQQMVELACALSHQAEVWIFDETTAPLTPKEVEELFAVMRKLRDEGSALAIVTHHLEEVFQIADRVAVLRDGKKVAEKEIGETNIGEVVQFMVGRELSGERLSGSAPPTDTAFLRLEHLTGPGFRDISLEVRPGEVVALAGLVGAGRTELARALFGITQPTSGTIRVAGQTISIGCPRVAKACGIALVPEDRQHDGLLMPQSISFNSTLPSLRRLSKHGWIRPREIEAASEEYADRLNLVRRGQEQPVFQLSGGNQQKVVLSKWLMTGPKLLILDEPTRGVDVGAKHEVHKLIRSQADAGMAVLMISSDLLEVLALSDRVLVMREGSLVAEFEGPGTTQEAIMNAAARGVA